MENWIEIVEEHKALVDRTEVEILVLKSSVPAPEVGRRRGILAALDTLRGY